MEKSPSPLGIESRVSAWTAISSDLLLRERDGYVAVSPMHHRARRFRLGHHLTEADHPARHGLEADRLGLIGAVEDHEVRRFALLYAVLHLGRAGGVVG